MSVKVKVWDGSKVEDVILFRSLLLSLSFTLFAKKQQARYVHYEKWIIYMIDGYRYVCFILGLNCSG